MLKPAEEDKYYLAEEDETAEGDEYDGEKTLLTEDGEFAISCIIRFLKRNRSLLHVNLSNTGLNEAALWPFGAALRRTKSLRSIHLSGN